MKSLGEEKKKYSVLKKNWRPKKKPCGIVKGGRSVPMGPSKRTNKNKGWPGMVAGKPDSLLGHFNLLT